MRDATRELIEEPDPPPPDLFGRIMSAVRADVRRGRAVTVDSAEPGSVQVSEQAVAVLLRYAADTVDGVRARSCRVRGVDGLWVVDGSILPTITSRGPHATIVMIGHRAAEFICPPMSWPVLQ